VTLGSMCLSLLQVFKGHRKRTEGVTEARAGRFKMVSSSRWRISNATWDRSVSSNYLDRAVSDHIIAEFVLPGAERAQRRADAADHS